MIIIDLGGAANPGANRRISKSGALPGMTKQPDTSNPRSSRRVHQMKNMDLPHDVILSIERILSIENAPYADSLDTLSSLFNPVRTLNELFPDGQHSL